MSDHAAYDPAARRPTPLALKLAERIGREGPISLAHFMQACLQDPEHGYYRRRTALGAGGDFITAPEISQVFGELIGLWCAVVWQQMGEPDPIHLVEIGPGRGTLMRDALRAARVVPRFRRAIRLHLVETSEALRTVQREALAGDGIDLSHADEPVPQESCNITIANELIDALPVEQWLCVSATGAGGWQQRHVGLDPAGRLVLEWREPQPAVLREHGPGADRRRPGEIVESRNIALLEPLWARSFPPSARAGARGPAGAALLIDYGHARRMAGETLQAVRNHAPEHPLTSPGEADLTAHVDFAELAALHAPLKDRIVVDGPVTQAELLGALGIAERASRLMAANPAQAGEIEAGVARLLSPTGMGTRFKAIGLRSPHLPRLPGFPG